MLGTLTPLRVRQQVTVRLQAAGTLTSVHAAYIELGVSLASPTVPKAWISYAPALLISISGLGVAGMLGGPIAAAITAFAALPSFVAASIVTFAVRIKYKPSTTSAALGLGFGLYLAATLVVLICLELFGPSQKNPFQVLPSRCGEPGRDDRGPQPWPSDGPLPATFLINENLLMASLLSTFRAARRGRRRVALAPANCRH